MTFELHHFDNVAVPPWGQELGPMDVAVHGREACEGRACVIHHPSDHHMRTWPTTYRADLGVTERMCPHGVGHPDPDDIAYHTSRGQDHLSIHGCDGCCRSGDLVGVKG